jgi:RNA polymerase sigma-70 factor, ECF subfamily
MPLSELLSTADEKVLIERCRRGCLEAFDELIRIYQDRVYNLALGLLSDPEDALDLSQDVFIICFRKIASYRGEAAFFTWLYRITVNQAKNFWKKKSRTPTAKSISIDEPYRLNQGDAVPFLIPDSSPGPDRISEGKELISIIQSKMADLSMEHRQVLLLRFSENLSYEEMSHVMDSSVGTVKSRLNRARAILRKKMEPYMD